MAGYWRTGTRISEITLGWTAGAKLDLCFTLALTFYPLPSIFTAFRRDRAEAKGEGGQERKWQLAGIGRADERPVNPVARIFMETANDSPSPWGEGRDEGGHGPFETLKDNQNLTLCQYSGLVSVSEKVSE